MVTGGQGATLHTWALKTNWLSTDVNSEIITSKDKILKQNQTGKMHIVKYFPGKYLTLCLFPTSSFW